MLLGGFSDPGEHVVMLSADGCIFVCTAHHFLAVVCCNSDCENCQSWNAGRLAEAALSFQVRDDIRMRYKIQDLQWKESNVGRSIFERTAEREF